MNMEQMSTYISFMLFLSALFLWGYNRNHVGNAVQAGLPGGIPVTIKAIAGHFIPTGNIRTTVAIAADRTVASFAAGDRMGVFVVKDGIVLDGCDNVPCTFNGTGWIPDRPMYFDSGATYLAYYPYHEVMNGKACSDEIVNCFATRLYTADQSTRELYAACDLMTAEVINPLSESLTFSFRHEMVMLEIALPMRRYRVSDEADAYEYSTPVLAHFTIAGKDDTKPYRQGKGIYRYLVIPSASEIMVDVELKVGEKTVTCSKEILAVATGSYKRIDVACREIPSDVAIRPLAVGDYYYSDGSICPRELTPLKEGCIGIVMKAGRDETDTSAFPAIHGYVLGLYDANGSCPSPWSSSGIATGTQTVSTGFNGYGDTLSVRQHAAGNGLDLKAVFPAVYYATADYEKRYPAPASASGWFLPSAGQCRCWYANEAALLKSIRRVTGNKSYTWCDYYWSASETSNLPSLLVWLLSFDHRKMDFESKVCDNYIRPCLTF